MVVGNGCILVKMVRIGRIELLIEQTGGEAVGLVHDWGECSRQGE